MRTALDTNILSALWSKEASAAGIAGEAKQAGAVPISGIVYAELLAYPGATEEFLREFCEHTGIIIEFRFQDAVWGGSWATTGEVCKPS